MTNEIEDHATRHWTRSPSVAAQVDAPALDEAATPFAAPPAGGNLPTLAHVRDDLLPPGTILGRYVLLGPIGSGGLGDVYAAYDPELDRKVAIKLLKADVFGRVDLQRLQNRLFREAQAMAKLSHPNVVAVHDVGLHGENVFIAMAYVDGLTLRDWLKAEARSWTEIRDVLVQAGRGLLAAHEAGLVHRDFKPTNVMVDAQGRVLVLDFGLARRAGNASGASSADDLPSASIPSKRRLLEGDGGVTQTGTVLGTPGYMAPEQYDGDAVDPRVDQFAFCVTAYQAFWGERPYQGRGNALVCAVRSGAITPPKNQPRIPAWLGRAILRGLQPQPEARWPGMDVLLHELSRDRRSRRWQVIGFSAAVLLSAGGGAALYGSLTASGPASDRVDELVRAAHQAAARSYFVYPPAHDRDQPTAYRIVIELEQQEGEDDAPGDIKALELRREFTQTLTSLGDRYSGVSGGAPFATDYYAQALVFDPDNAHARERVVMTTGELVALQDKATNMSFTDAELQAAELLAIFAIEDEDERNEQLAEAFAVPERGAGLSTRTAVAAIVGDDESRVFGTHPRQFDRRSLEPEAAAETPPDSEGASDMGSTKRSRDESGEPQPTESRTTSSTKSDPAKAGALVKNAVNAFRSGKIGEAEKLLHQALEADRGSHLALITLSELHYQRGNYRDAAKFASNAVKLVPRKSDYQIQLGDAYFKVLRYTDARTHYEKAEALGDSRARERLKRLESKLGK
jgi:tetratricopeptide (TPR) repeat protein